MKMRLISHGAAAAEPEFPSRSCLAWPSRWAGIFTLWLSVLCWCANLAGAQTDISERFRLATEAMREGRLDEAGEDFSSIVRDSPAFAEGYFNLGLVREEQGKNEQAIANLQKALQLKPRLRGANLFLGVAEYHLNDLDQAIAAFRKEIASSPSDPNAWMWLGVAQLAAGNHEEAASALDKAAQLDPTNADILYHRGRAHLLVSKDSYAAMFKIDPSSWRVHQVLAQADAEADRHLDAIAEYEAAIQLAPNQPGLHEELGAEYRQAGKLDEAGAAFQQEIKIDPHNPLAFYKLGALEVEQGDGAKGKTLIEAALKQNPSLKNAAYYLGRADAELGDDAAAVEELKRATSADSDPEVVQQAWYQLGIVYRRMRRPDDAEKALAIFQKLKNEEAERQQERAEKARKTLGAGDTAVPETPHRP